MTSFDMDYQKSTVKEFSFYKERHVSYSGFRLKYVGDFIINVDFKND